MSATDDLGPHLLGRKYVADDRDYQLGDFLGDQAPGTDPLQAALNALVQSGHGAPEVRAWAVIATARILGTAPTPPTPVPVPPTPSNDVVWGDADVVLDQGQTGHCVGFGWAGWGDTLPIDDKFGNADGDAIYYEAKIIDGEPGAEDGSTVRSGAKAMQDRGRLSAYAFAASLDEVKAWVRQHGPVVFGTDWYDGMFSPDGDGIVTPSGSVAGGHCYACVGYHEAKDLYEFQNSWGASWGLKGRFLMHGSDAAILLGQQGEACAAVELP